MRDCEMGRYINCYREGKIRYFKANFQKDMETLKASLLELQQDYIKRYYTAFIKFTLTELVSAFESVDLSFQHENSNRLIKKLPIDGTGYEKLKAPLLDATDSTTLSDFFLEFQNNKYSSLKVLIDQNVFKPKDSFLEIVSES
ncbi:hypothetical protein RF11_00020 [Thelohanellus kitauei]|uniref:Uncharacterized protein n=1 Tax=Thelohanellus kitauei TaxID=669202 RepID=A0A0C2N306_THEKT|nr:hypothetical protein RF11_00020 [Thelohanellus kitauei]